VPIGNGRTILTHWLESAEEVAKLAGLEKLPVRIMVDASAMEPRSASPDKFSLEYDRSEYRGTGGLMANLAGEYEDDDLLIVANAAQILLDPLTALVTALRKTGGMVSVIGHRDGTPSGMMLVTCQSLRLIPKVGFVDMKEQGLPAIAERQDVRVLHCRRPTGLPIRTLADYIEALRAIHSPGGRATNGEALAEEWKSTFAIVEPGATVAPTARIHDSVVLAGAMIESGAVVVRSLVGPGGIVRYDKKAVDEYVTANGTKV